jgi:hypothetical protein
VAVDSGALLRDGLDPAQRAGQPAIEVDQGAGEGRAACRWPAGPGGGKDPAEFQPAGGQFGDRVRVLVPAVPQRRGAGRRRAARDETGRVRDDAEKTLAGFRAEAAAELAAVRSDLRARAERAEHAENQATPTAPKLDQLYGSASHGDSSPDNPARPLRRADRT